MHDAATNLRFEARLTDRIHQAQRRGSRRRRLTDLPVSPAVSTHSFRAVDGHVSTTLLLPQVLENRGLAAAPRHIPRSVLSGLGALSSWSRTARSRLSRALSPSTSTSTWSALWRLVEGQDLCNDRVGGRHVRTSVDPSERLARQRLRRRSDRRRIAAVHIPQTGQAIVVVFRVRWTSWRVAASARVVMPLSPRPSPVSDHLVASQCARCPTRSSRRSSSVSFMAW